MKVLVVGDLHMSRTSSILTAYGKNFTTRLEHCIATVNWIEATALETACDAIIYLGDFFNRAELDDETITAVKQIKWSPVQKYFLVGNHESSIAELKYSSTKILESSNAKIIAKPWSFATDDSSTMLYFLPYITELDRKKLEEYIPVRSDTSMVRQIVFSHNDIAGINYGAIESTVGFNKADILACSDLYINGHIHNYGWPVKDRICNIGIVSGQNFSEDASTYSHNILLVDTSTLSKTVIENPFAFNFYKLDVCSTDDLTKLKTVKNNAVLSIRCAAKLKNKLEEELIRSAERICEARIITIVDNQQASAEEKNLVDLTVDHLQKFIDCCHANIEQSSALDFELTKICG